MVKFNFAQVTTVSEASELWRIPVRTVQMWCDEGKVDATKIHGVWVISTASLVALKGQPFISHRANALDVLHDNAVR